MCLIFDSFPDRRRAKAFARDVARRYGLDAGVHDSQESSDAVDPFPYKLVPPIVLVERGENERAAESLVELYDGRFAGT